MSESKDSGDSRAVLWTMLLFLGVGGAIPLLIGYLGATHYWLGPDYGHHPKCVTADGAVSIRVEVLKIESSVPFLDIVLKAGETDDALECSVTRLEATPEHAYEVELLDLQTDTTSTHQLQACPD